MTFEFGGWAVLVHIAAITQIIGYLFRDQIVLRWLLLIGTFFYIAYYWLYPATPLWEAIFWAAMLATANIVVLVRLHIDRMQLAQSTEDAQLYRVFQGFTPGMFRQMMRIGEVATADAEMALTRENQPLDSLYFVIDSGFRVIKGKQSRDIMPGAFVGEVVFLSGGEASATVKIAEGTRYVRWQVEEIRALCRKNPELKLRLEALLNQDMARKVRFS